jgi:hypothetical protein
MSPFYSCLLIDCKILQNYNEIGFLGGFADEKTPIRRAKRVRAPRGAAKIFNFGKRR